VVATSISGNTDEVLSLLAHCFAGPEDEVIYSEHGFLVYPIAVRAAGAIPVPAPRRLRRPQGRSRWWR